MFTQKFIKIFHSVQEIGLFSLFQNLSLGNSSANPKWNLTISWATSGQHQCVCKILSKYSKRFKSYRHFSTFFTNRPASKSSQTVRWQNQMFDYRALYEIQFQVSVDFLTVVQLQPTLTTSRSRTPNCSRQDGIEMSLFSIGADYVSLADSTRSCIAVRCIRTDWRIDRRTDN